MPAEVLFPAQHKKIVTQVTDDMLFDLAYWEAKFQKMNFPGMDLVEATVYPLTLLEKINRKKQYARVKRDFLRYVSYNYVNDLRNAGLDEDSIFYFKPNCFCAPYHGNRGVRATQICNIPRQGAHICSTPATNPKCPVCAI